MIGVIHGSEVVNEVPETALDRLYDAQTAITCHSYVVAEERPVQFNIFSEPEYVDVIFRPTGKLVIAVTEPELTVIVSQLDAPTSFIITKWSVLICHDIS